MRCASATAAGPDRPATKQLIDMADDPACQQCKHLYLRAMGRWLILIMLLEEEISIERIVENLNCK
jgi:hypothetical protein